MASNLDTVMTHADAVEHFDECVLPWVVEQYEQDGEIDWPARSEAWLNWTDSLCKDGRISDWQYENWSHPRCCG